MSAVYASTDPKWFSHLNRLTPHAQRVAFWRPTDRQAKDISTGEPWFFKERGAARILGFGRFVEHQSTTPQRLWEEFQEGSGAPDMESLLQAISAARGKDRPTTLTTQIGNAVLVGFKAFEPPISLDEINLPNLSVPFRYVPINSSLLHLIDAPRALPEAEMTPASRKELSTEIFKRSSAHVAYVRSLYGGRCQMSGEPVLSGIGGDLTQVHHIDFLSNGGTDHPSNMMSLSPNWHALAHAAATHFDWSTLEFIVDGQRFSMAVNKHLKPRQSASQSAGVDVVNA